MSFSVRKLFAKWNVSFSAKLIGEMKCVIKCEINWGKANVSFSANIIGETKCVIQREISWGNEMCHLARN